MPDSDWRNWIKGHGGLAASVFAAILFIVLVVWPSWLQQRELYNEATRNAEHYARDAKDQIAIKCTGLTGQARTDCTNKENETARDRQRDEYDLYSQQAMALWTGVMGGMAVVGVSVSLIGVYLIWQTWSEAKRTTAVAKTIGEKQARAYLNVSEIWAETDSPSDIFFRFKLKNTGNSPARNVRFSGFIILQSENENVMCDSWQSEGRQERYVAAIPASSESDDIGVPFGREFGFPDMPNVAGRRVQFVINVRYKTVFSNDDEICAFGTYDSNPYRIPLQSGGKITFKIIDMGDNIYQ